MFRQEERSWTPPSPCTRPPMSPLASHCVLSAGRAQKTTMVLRTGQRTWGLWLPRRRLSCPLNTAMPGAPSLCLDLLGWEQAGLGCWCSPALVTQGLGVLGLFGITRPLCVVPGTIHHHSVVPAAPSIESCVPTQPWQAVCPHGMTPTDPGGLCHSVCQAQVAATIPMTWHSCWVWGCQRRHRHRLLVQAQAGFSALTWLLSELK